MQTLKLASIGNSLGVILSKKMPALLPKNIKALDERQGIAHDAWRRATCQSGQARTAVVIGLTPRAQMDNRFLVL